MTIVFRLLETDDKGAALHQAIQQLAQKEPDSITFTVEPESFQQIPGAPFAYWVSESIRQVFNQSFKAEPVYETRCGMGTLDDFRFLRLNWEITKSSLDKSHIRYAKGGQFSFFYSDIYIVLNWGVAGREVKQFVEQKVGSASRKIQAESYYLRSGLTYPARTVSGLNVRAMPKGCIFSHKGPAIFVKDDNPKKLLALLSLVNSEAFHAFVELQMTVGSYEVGVIQRTPVPDFTLESITPLSTLSHRAWSLKRSLDTVTQMSHAFMLPALLQVKDSHLGESARIWTDKVAVIQTELAQIQTQINDLVFDLYGISESDRAGLSRSNPVGESESGNDDDDEDDNLAAADLPTFTRELLDYLCSVACGRFDVRLVTGEREFPSEPEPFDPLPVCSPGMLVGENGLPPTAPDEVPTGYPIQIPFDGILVDDEGHPNDIVRHVRQVLKVIWGEKDSDIEQEACEILKVSSLRDYFRKPAAFFNDHLTRYSKSRRQAPIYLPLSTASGSYTLWLYYHRLTDQTLYTCINDYVEPKLSRVSETVKFLRGKTTRTRDEENDLENLQTLEDELTKFRDELLRVAKLPWKPNLNDGVQITVAPLHSLFRLSKWQKKLKETWDKLEKGDYDWAHLAYSLRPMQVREKCRTDKSLAIAHGLEDLYELPPETPKRTKRKKKE